MFYITLGRRSMYYLCCRCENIHKNFFCLCYWPSLFQNCYVKQVDKIMVNTGITSVTTVIALGLANKIEKWTTWLKIFETQRGSIFIHPGNIYSIEILRWQIIEYVPILLLWHMEYQNLLSIVFNVLSGLKSFDSQKYFGKNIDLGCGVLTNFSSRNARDPHLKS